MGTLLTTLLFAALELAPAPTPGQDCGAQVCIYAANRKAEPVFGSDASIWRSGEQLSAKKRSKEAKRNRKRKDVGLSVALEGSRGSVFVDGRYLASSGPHAQRGVKPGKHEIEIRDGDTVLAAGVLIVSRKVAAVTLVVHAGRS